MKRITIIWTFALMFVVNSFAQTNSINGEILADTNEVLVLKVWGTSYERGYAYGYLAADKIENVIEGFLIPTFGNAYSSARNLITADETFEIDSLFQNEAKAIVNGMALAGIDTTSIDFVDLLVLNCFFDLEGFFNKVNGFGCSTFLNWGSATENTDLDGKSVISRHYDYPYYIPALANNAVLVIHLPTEENTQPWLLGDAAGWFTPSGLGINQQGVSVFQNTMSDCNCSPAIDAGYEPFLFTLRRALESADYNGDGVNNTQDVREALSSNQQGYAGGYIISTLARYNNESDSLTALIAEIAPEEPLLTFRTNAYNDMIPGDNLYAANAQIKRNNANNYCSRYLNIVNHMGDGTGISSTENWNLMRDYSNVTYNYLFIQYIPDWNVLKASVYRDNCNAWQLEPTTFYLLELFNRPPEFMSEADTAAILNVNYVYEIIVSDPDPNDTLTILAEQIPYWLNYVDNGNGNALLSGTPDQTGIFQVILSAYDGIEVVTQEYEIFVEELTGCLPDGITFTTQEQIDNFQINHPNCTEIEGSVTIGTIFAETTNINNLNGLSVITSLGEDLSIYNNDSLVSLEGLNNLTYIGGSLSTAIFFDLGGMFKGVRGCNNLFSVESLTNLIYLGADLKIWETGLLNLSGLEGLTSIPGDLKVGIYTEWPTAKVEAGNNLHLKDLTGLENIASVGGILQIEYNDSITDISSLNENIMVDTLVIRFNPLLSECDIQTVCNHLSYGNSYSNIELNAPGCNSPEEVEEACMETSINEILSEFEISIHPNPVKDYVDFSFNYSKSDLAVICIYNTTGTCIFQKEISSTEIIKLNMIHYPAGIYLCRMMVGDKIVTKKIIKQ